MENNITIVEKNIATKHIIFISDDDFDFLCSFISFPHTFTIIIPGASFYWYGLTLVVAWICNPMYNKV